MDKHEQFKRLYKKFVDGTRWLNQKIQDGTVTDQDRDDFNRLVVEPMDGLWATFTDEEKKSWDTVKYAVELFDGTIVLEEEEQRKRQLEHKKKGKKKRWRSYFRRY